MSPSDPRHCSAAISSEAVCVSGEMAVRVSTDLQCGLPILPGETQMVALALGDRLDAFLATLTEADAQPDQPA